MNYASATKVVLWNPKQSKNKKITSAACWAKNLSVYSSVRQPWGEDNGRLVYIGIVWDKKDNL